MESSRNCCQTTRREAADEDSMEVICQDRRYRRFFVSLCGSDSGGSATSIALTTRVAQKPSDWHLPNHLILKGSNQ
jgi:hypothetical protein